MPMEHHLNASAPQSLRAGLDSATAPEGSITGVPLNRLERSHPDSNFLNVAQLLRDILCYMSVGPLVAGVRPAYARHRAPFDSYHSVARGDKYMDSIPELEAYRVECT